MSPPCDLHVPLLGILSEERLQRLQRHLLMKRDLTNILQEDKTDDTIERLFR